MYLEFYQLKQAPFHITPDPDFLFLSPSHKAALGALVYGIAERQGFMTLLAEVGLGKTTIVRAYMDRVAPAQLKAVYIFNPNLTFVELLGLLCRQFGMTPGSSDVTTQVMRLQQALIDAYQQGRNVALIIDEVQLMPQETLEQLRLLSNIETATQKLIQIVLVGQPEFADMLNVPELWALKQRLALQPTLRPLTAQESHEYIHERLAKVQTEPGPLFTKRALRMLIRAAQGTPRVLNILCTNALIYGAAYNAQLITARIVKEVIAEHQDRPPRRWWRRLLFMGAVAGLVALGAWSLSAGLGWEPLDGLHRVVRGTQPAPIATPPLPPGAGQPSAVFSSPNGPATARSVPSPAEVASSSPSASAAPPRLRTLQPGESLTRVALEVYGFSNNAVLAWIHQHNPDLRTSQASSLSVALQLPPLPSAAP